MDIEDLASLYHEHQDDMEMMAGIPESVNLLAELGGENFVAVTYHVARGEPLPRSLGGDGTFESGRVLHLDSSYTSKAAAFETLCGSNWPRLFDAVRQGFIAMYGERASIYANGTFESSALWTAISLILSSHTSNGISGHVTYDLARRWQTSSGEPQLEWTFPCIR